MTTIAFIDFEAPALSKKVAPIEVGVALWTRARPILTWSSLIWREPDATWSDASEKIHRISRDMLLAAPRPLEVAAVLNEIMNDYPVAHCDGYNFDLAWHSQLFNAASIKPGFRVEALPTGYDLTLDEPVEHRAGPDAVQLMKEYAYQTYREHPLVIQFSPRGE